MGENTILVSSWLLICSSYFPFFSYPPTPLGLPLTLFPPLFSPSLPLSSTLPLPSPSLLPLHSLLYPLFSSPPLPSFPLPPFSPHPTSSPLPSLLPSLLSSPLMSPPLLSPPFLSPSSPLPFPSHTQVDEQSEWIAGSKNKKRNKQGGEENDSDDKESSDEQLDKLVIYKQILEILKPGESVPKAVRRLGGVKSKAASERWRKERKKTNGKETETKVRCGLLLWV